jgi:hypothetical protein
MFETYKASVEKADKTDKALLARLAETWKKIQEYKTKNSI